MAGAAWDDEVASARVEANLVALKTAIVDASLASREQPTADLVLDWHRAMLDGVDIPDDAYRGAFRGSAHPAVIDYETNVGGLPTTRAAEVQLEVSTLIAELQQRVGNIDALDDQSDMLTPGFVEAVLETAAWLHGEWIRIHPFVNGNGRTARMWVLWLCARYGLPQLLALRPRPDMGYSPACMASMVGDHGLLLGYLLYRFNAT
jgi:Fic family protein